MKRPLAIAFTLFPWVLVTAGAREVAADVTLGIETNVSAAQEPQATRAYLQRDKLKLELKPAGGAAQDIIFREDLGRLWIVDRAARSYRAVDRKQMQAMGEQMDQALRSLESDLERMPPAERKRVEQLMLGEKPSGEPPATEFRKTDRKDTIDGLPCTGYDYYRGAEKVGEAWLASWDTIGLDPDTFAVFESFQKFLRAGGGAAPGLKRGIRADLANLSRLDGFPLVIRDVKEGKVMSESRMKVLDRGPVPPDQFEVPADFKEQPLPSISGGK
jgi:hypothetical protein